MFGWFKKDDRVSRRLAELEGYSESLREYHESLRRYHEGLKDWAKLEQRGDELALERLLHQVGCTCSDAATNPQCPSEDARRLLGKLRRGEVELRDPETVRVHLRRLERSTVE